MRVAGERPARQGKKKKSTSTSLHRATKVRVIKLETADSIALTISDSDRNEVTLFLNSIDELVNLGTIIRKGGTYGIEYSVQTGKPVGELGKVPTISEYFQA